MMVNAQADAQEVPSLPKVALKQRYGKQEISTCHHLNFAPLDQKQIASPKRPEDAGSNPARRTTYHPHNLR